MRSDPRAAVQATLDTLLAHADEAIARANAAITGALKRRDVGAARQALNAVHECSEFRETVLYVARRWAKVQLPFAEVKRSSRVPVQKA